MPTLVILRERVLISAIAVPIGGLADLGPIYECRKSESARTSRGPGRLVILAKRGNGPLNSSPALFKVSRTS